jgi:23S rRNA (pseudouridine1915-N3)-methyltransferase
LKLRILSVGHKMPDWVEKACADYLKRMPREASVDIIEIKPDKRASGKNAEVVQEAEAARILEAAGKDLLAARKSLPCNSHNGWKPGSAADVTSPW